MTIAETTQAEFTDRDLAQMHADARQKGIDDAYVAMARLSREDAAMVREWLLAGKKNHGELNQVIAGYIHDLLATCSGSNLA